MLATAMENKLLFFNLMRLVRKVRNLPSLPLRRLFWQDDQNFCGFPNKFIAEASNTWENMV